MPRPSEPNTIGQLIDKINEELDKCFEILREHNTPLLFKKEKEDASICKENSEYTPSIPG